MSIVSYLAAVYLFYFVVIKYEKYRREWIERRALFMQCPHTFKQIRCTPYVGPIGLCDI